MRVATSRKNAPNNEAPSPPSAEAEGGVAAGACRVEMLGRLRLVRGTRSVSRFRTQKTGALLAYLAYHADRNHPRELLADHFWPDATPDSARHSLRLALSDLRRLLDLDEDGTSTPGGGIIVADRHTVELRPGAVQTDVAAFEGILGRLPHVQSPQERRHLLETAVDLYAGPLLPGMYEPWVAAQQIRLEDRYIEAIMELIALLKEAGDTTAALRRARQSAVLLPDSDEITEAQSQLLPGRALPRPGSGTAPKPVAYAPARPEPSLPLYALPVAFVSGTFTLLAVDDGAQAVETSFAQLAQRHGATVLRAAPAFCLLAFRSVRDALAALEVLKATGCLNRAALHTGEIQSCKESGSGTPAPGDAPFHLAEALLQATPPGTCVCTEATAHLLRTAPPDTARLVSLGSYHLLGPSSTDRIFRVTLPGTPADAPAPALHARRADGANLPVPLTRFFGREAELASLTSPRLFAPDRARLLTLIGPGGIGKTRLALEVARRLADDYRSGICCFVSFADTTDPALAWDAVRRALGLPPPGPGFAPRDQIADALRAHPCALLLLDNAEHLLSESESSGDTFSALVTDLLERVPALDCLVTSRRPLGLVGEREFPIFPLPVPETGQEGENPALPSGYSSPAAAHEQTPADRRSPVTPSVALFVDRAKAARPDFLLTERNERAVEELCRQLEGLPLGLELAAARVNVLSPAQMLGQIGDRLDLLTRRGQGGVARHRSLRATVQWSYDLLPPEQKTAFARLAIFRGGWDANAAAAVWEVSRTHAHDLLDDLRSHSLLVAKDTGDEMRYRMLETIRAFAEECLTGEERNRAGRLHAQHYFVRAEAARKAMEVPHLPSHELQAIDRAMETEYDNVRAALAFCQAGTDEDRQHSLRLAVSMTPRWYWRGHLTEGQQWLETLLDNALASPLPLPEPLEGAVRMSLGTFYRIVGHAHPARRELQRAVELLKKYPNDEYLPWAHQVLAVSLLDTGEYVEMERHNRAAEAIWERRGHRHGVALSRYNDGLKHYRCGDTRQAEAAVTEAEVLCRASGADLYLGLSLSLLGCILNDQARHEEAIGRFREALTFFREQGIWQFVGLTLRDEGTAHFSRGDYDAALACGAEAEQIFLQTGGRYGASLTRFWNAQAYLYRNAPGDAARGETLLSRVEADAAAGIGANLPNYVALIRATVTLRAAHVPADVQAVLPALQTSLGHFLAQNERATIACCLEFLADAHYRLGAPERAALLLNAADALRGVLGSPVAQNERYWMDRLRQCLSEVLTSSAAYADSGTWYTIARNEADSVSLPRIH